MLRRLDRTETRRIRHRKAQARHIERVRNCRALYQVELGCRELDKLVRLRYLAEADAGNDAAVGEAIARLLKNLPVD